MKKNKKSSKLLVIFLIVIVVLIGGFLILNSWYNNAIYSPASSENKDIDITVDEGENFISILPRLKEAGLIKDETAVRIYLRLQNISPVIKVGSYTIASTVNTPGLIELLGKGVFKSSVLVTIREALKYEDIADLLETKFADNSDIKFSKSEFLAICQSPDNYEFSADVTSFLAAAKPSGKPLRGFLFPDTYRFDIDVDSKTIIETLILNFQKRLTENNIEIKGNSTVTSFYQIVTLASIIEKEASKTDNANLISGIFYNRLKDNYPLQADSTVNFVTGKNDAGVLITDSQIDSPYNTYKYPGLPPTPINNPGIRSIKAAYSPESTEYFFFIHDANGKSYFAKTFAEHQQNISNYL